MTSIYVGISLGFIMGTGREIFLLQPPPGHLHPVRHGLEAVHCRPHIQLSKPVSAGLQLPVVIVDYVADLPSTPGASDIRHQSSRDVRRGCDLPVNDPVVSVKRHLVAHPASEPGAG